MPFAMPTKSWTAAGPPFTGSVTIPPFTDSVTIPSAILSGVSLRVAPKVRVVDVSLVHDGRRQRVLKIALQVDVRAVVVGGLASRVGLPFEGRPRVEDCILRVGVGRLRNSRVELAGADQRVLMRHAIVADQDDVR